MSDQPDDLADWTATELVAGYADHSVSPVEATRAVLDRIDARDAELNAFCLVDADGALEQARSPESRWHAGEPAGPVDGVPTSIKDLLLTRGWPTLRGSRTIDPRQAWDVDAPVVARLRESGAVLVGKTTTPELGWKGVTDGPLTGVTRNPCEPTRTAGGSSGGAAAAVAAGMGPLAIGTDGGGSIRIPAGFCGIVGFKPTYGRIPLYPASPFGTLAHVGPMTRSVQDAALMLDVVSGFDARDWSALPPPVATFRERLGGGVAGCRIAFSPDLGYAEVDPEVAASVRRAVEVLAGLGAVVEEVDPGFADPVRAYHVLWFSGAAKSLERLPAPQWDLVDSGVAGDLRGGPDPVRARLPRRDGRAHGARCADGGVPRALRPARHADPADSRVPRRPRGAARIAAPALDELDPVHLSVQPHPAARDHRPLRCDGGRAAGRPADRRPAARRRARPRRGRCLRGGDRVARTPPRSWSSAELSHSAPDAPERADERLTNAHLALCRRSHGVPTTPPQLSGPRTPAVVGASHSGTPSPTRWLRTESHDPGGPDRGNIPLDAAWPGSSGVRPAHRLPRWSTC